MKWKYSSTDPRYASAYNAWKSAKRRCYVPTAKGFHNYGGRGLVLCDRWVNDFDAFLEDMGSCPPGLTLERVDVNGNYEPFNCVWASWEDQHKNKRPRIRTKAPYIAKTEKWEREVNREIARQHKSLYQPAQPVHGSKKMYAKHKCRCDLCVASQRERWRRKLTANPERHERKKAYLRDYQRRKKLTYDL